MRRSFLNIFFLLFLLLLIFATNAFATSQKTLHSFTGGADGAFPLGGLVVDSQGNFYGVTNAGGNNECDSLLSTGCGIVFQLKPNADGSWSETILHVFEQSLDGGQPLASPIMDAAGNLYGSTQYYGLHDDGVIWQLTAGVWSENILHAFGAANDGFWCAGLSFDPRGHLFGTTYAGGANNNGTVFQLAPASGGRWREMIIHNFAGGSKDGNAPSDATIFDAHGDVFGTSYEGGPNLAGTVFEMQHSSTGWTEKPIYFFQGLAFGGGSDGANPSAGLVSDTAGNLYGTTSYGGGAAVGTVYELSPNGSGGWTETALYTFTDGSDGGHPGRLIIDAAGNLYGVTSGHRTFGSVFELSPSAGKWNFAVLYDFQNGADGATPAGSLLRDAAGNLYGATEFGGASGLGTIFEITP